MAATENAIVEYGLSDMNLVASSSAAMAQVLQDKYEAQEPVVVTGWTPHWKFAAMDLKYLEDPKGVYGDAEHINTIVRLGLAKICRMHMRFWINFIGLLNKWQR